MVTMGPFWQGGRFDRTPLSVASRVNISLSLALAFCPDAHDSVTTWGRARSCLNKHGNIISFEWHFLFSYLRTVDCAFPLKNYQLRNYTHTHNRSTAVGPGQPGYRPVPGETLTHSHPSWSSDILYQLSLFTTIHGILCVQFTCLTVLFDNLSPGPQRMT